MDKSKHNHLMETLNGAKGDTDVIKLTTRGEGVLMLLWVVSLSISQRDT